MRPLNYDAMLNDAIENLHTEGRYRTFIDIERERGQYPHAVWTRPDGEK
ncbi:MAG: 5-aminolevulinate synthase, partial [Rhodobacterales bacterium]